MMTLKLHLLNNTVLCRNWFTNLNSSLRLVRWNCRLKLEYQISLWTRTRHSSWERALDPTKTNNLAFNSESFFVIINCPWSYFQVDNWEVSILNPNDGLEIISTQSLGDRARCSEKGPERSVKFGFARLTIALIIHAQHPVDVSVSRGI